MPRPKLIKTEDDDVVSDLLGTVNRHATSSQGYLQGDHAQHTWGVPIPAMAFQYLIGGSNVLPMQRFIGISGEAKSFKSTLQVEIGNWFIKDGGVHLYLDTEGKTSPTMLEAMSRAAGTGARRIYKQAANIQEWQTILTKMIEKARDAYRRPVGKRVPIFIAIDSLTGTSTEDADRNLRKEGAAAERGYPVEAAAITNFLKAFNMLGTTASVAWIQHMKQALDQTGAGYGGPLMKETGAKAAQFSCSAHIRVNKGGTVRKGSHPGAPLPDYPVEGHTLFLKTELSCVGPDKRVLPVDLLWQYVPDQDGNRVQHMWYDWDGALGNMLYSMKYSDKWKPALYEAEKTELNDLLGISEGSKASVVSCKRLDLKDVSFTEFGKAIRDNEEVAAQVSRFLRINRYPAVQEADIDFEAGDLRDKLKR